MKKQIQIRNLALLGAALTVFATGCSTTEMARTDVDETTVSALSFGPQTQPRQLAKWPLEWNVKVHETYTFAVPDPGLTADMDADTGRTTFTEATPRGAAFEEAAGAGTSVRGYRVVRHSPNPR